jgi:2-dehydro-3-deoxyphosphogluconate aldolase / (4S)-4-hydroxy-2-oxoglutarate aldolase
VPADTLQSAESPRISPNSGDRSHDVGVTAATDFVEVLWRHRTSAIVRAPDTRLAADAMQAAVDGGVRIVEFTLTTPGAHELIEDFVERRALCEVDGLDHLVVGAGTVLTVQQAERAVKAGARFLVSPVADPKIIAAARSLGVAMMPGVHTPTEMTTAHRAGAPLLKLFPAPTGGPAWLRSVLAPLPFLRVVPTNGVDEGNLATWLAAGAWAVGLVGTLFVAEDLERRDFKAIESRARSFRAAAMSVSRDPPQVVSDPYLG